MSFPGATGTAFVLTAALTADSGATFSVLVSNFAGTVSSVPATLTVTPTAGAPTIQRHPERVRTFVGQTGTFSVSASSSTPMTYQWQKGTFTGNMLDIPGATGPSHTIPIAMLRDHHTLFRCIVSNAAGQATSASEMLFVTEPVAK